MARVGVGAHNRVLAAGRKRAEELEPRLAAILQPILAQAGDRAAAAFRHHAHVGIQASALRAADRDALERLDLPPAEVPAFGWSLGLVASGPLQGVERTSTMVAVKPRIEEARAIADPDGTPPEDLHVTLAYLGEIDGDLGAVLAALRAVAAQHAPLEGVVGGYGEFRPPGCGILLPDVPGLVELRVAATEALEAAGVGYGRDHGFQPHMTVDGSPEDGEIDVMLERAAGAPLHFDELLVVRGDAEVHALPLTGVLPVTAAGVPGEPPRWHKPAGDELVNVDQLVSTLRTKTDPVRVAVVRSTMGKSLEQAGISFDATNPLTAKVLAQSGSQIKEIASTTRANVMRIVGRSYDQGLSIPDTATAIRAGMRDASVARSVMIARTELAGAVNGGSLAATQIVEQETGAGYVKRWLTAPGAPFPRHDLVEGLNGQTAPLDGYFDVSGSQLQFPGDPDGDPGEVINCRCALVYDTPEGQQTGDAESGIDLPTEGAAGLGDAAGGDIGGLASISAPAEAQVPDTVSVAEGPPVPFAMREKIAKLGLDRPLDDLTPTTAIGRSVYRTARDTTGIHAPGGEWSADRKSLHDDIVAAHFAGKDAAGPADPTAYFTAGGGASGKSGALFDVAGRDVGLQELGSRPDTVWIDPDRIKEMLPEYKVLRDVNDFYAASGVHEESLILAKRITAEAQARGLSMIVDTTGSSDGFVRKIEAAKNAGYETKATMFSVPTNEAIARSIARGDRRGRYVAIQALKKAHAGASRQLGIWMGDPAVGSWRVYDNSGSVPRLVADQDGVYDQAALDAILAKASG